MKILTMFGGGHDSNASFYDGEKTHYVKYERINNAKHYKAGRFEMFETISEHFGFSWSEIDALFLDGTFLNGKYYSEVYTVESLNDFTSYFKLPAEHNLYAEYCENIYIVGHHLCHALQWWCVTEEEPDLYIVIDGVGDSRSITVFDKDMKIIDSVFLDKQGSIGVALEDFGDVLGFTGSRVDHAGKVMSRIADGNIIPEFLAELREKYPSPYVPFHKIFTDTGLIGEWMHYKNWNWSDSEKQSTEFLDPAATVYARLGELVHQIFDKHAKPTDRIFYSGGVALNVTWNTQLRKKYPNIIIAPFCNDDGLSAGSMFLATSILGIDIPVYENFPYCQNDVAPKGVPSAEIISETAKFLQGGNLVAWYQGNGEVGPRALGNRSLLLDPTIPDGKDLVNSVKHREEWRPFGASVLEEHMHEFFDIDGPDKYMLFTAKPKYDMPAITHTDGTCRVQTVTEKDNPIFYALLKEFYKQTGCPVLLNTSLNDNGKPIASKPSIPLDFFSENFIQVVVIGDKMHINYENNTPLSITG